MTEKYLENGQEKDGFYQYKIKDRGTVEIVFNNKIFQRACFVPDFKLYDNKPFSDNDRLLRRSEWKILEEIGGKICEIENE